MIAHQICLDLSWESSQESFPELLLETEEQILIGQCLKGDRVAQKKLYENHFHDLYAICMRYAKNTDDAKDVLQDGFVKIFGKLKSYTGEGSFNGWMKLVMVHTALDTDGIYAVNIADYKMGKDQYAIVERWKELSQKCGFRYLDTVQMMLNVRPGVGNGKSEKAFKSEGIYVFGKIAR